MAGKMIFRGPVDRQPQTVLGLLASALKPGVLVTHDGTNLTVASDSSTDVELFMLTNRQYSGQSVDTAYTSGDSGDAYHMGVGDVFQARMAAATYAKGDALTVGASGYMEAAATGERVLAYYEGTAGAVSADALQDVRIANSFAAS